MVPASGSMGVVTDRIPGMRRAMASASRMVTVGGRVRGRQVSRGGRDDGHECPVRDAQRDEARAIAQERDRPLRQLGRECRVLRAADTLEARLDARGQPLAEPLDTPRRVGRGGQRSKASDDGRQLSGSIGLARAREQQVHARHDRIECGRGDSGLVDGTHVEGIGHDHALEAHSLTQQVAQDGRRPQRRADLAIGLQRRVGGMRDHRPGARPPRRQPGTAPAPAPRASRGPPPPRAARGAGRRASRRFPGNA